MAAPLLLIDSYSQIYRGYYAIRALTTAQGIPSNAVFAMTKLLMKLKEEYEGYEGAFVFDKGRPAQRMALAPAYKANRPPMPDDLRSQLEIIRDMIHAFGWNIIEWDGAEADDLIAAAAANFTDRKVLIVSSDKDISQVIDERVEMLVPDHDGKGFTRRGIEETIAKFGVNPSAIVDYLALIGDSSDNIPGVEGVGPKTAAALLNQLADLLLGCNLRIVDTQNVISRLHNIFPGLRMYPLQTGQLLRAHHQDMIHFHVNSHRHSHRVQTLLLGLHHFHLLERDQPQETTLIGLPRSRGLHCAGCLHISRFLYRLQRGGNIQFQVFRAARHRYLVGNVSIQKRHREQQVHRRSRGKQFSSISEQTISQGLSSLPYRAAKPISPKSDTRWLCI